MHMCQLAFQCHLKKYLYLTIKTVLFNFQGEKVFYFVEPSEENFVQYEKWVSSARQSEVFFGDMVKQCYKCSVKPGQTLFIPTGINFILTGIFYM